MKKALCIFLAVFMLFTAPTLSVYAEDKAPETASTSQKAEKKQKKAVKNGWVVTKKGKKKYYKNGKLVKSRLIKIKKYYYYFNRYGTLKKGQALKYKKKTLYLSNKGRLRAYSKSGKFYFPGGEKMSKAEAEDFKCRLTAEKIASEITNADMYKSTKLSVCFNWVMKKYYATHRQSCNVSYWPAVYANDHFNNRGGDCHSDAAAFAYLAAAIGYKNVYVCNDASYVSPKAHAWTEIDGKVYDPLFAQAKSYSRNYGVSYSTYRLSPVLRVNLDYNKNRPRK